MKNSEIDIEKMIHKYDQIFKSEENTKENNYKFPVKNLYELSLMHISLIDNLTYLTQLQDVDFNDEKFKNSLQWICKLLAASYPENELEEPRELIGHFKSIQNMK